MAAENINDLQKWLAALVKICPPSVKINVQPERRYSHLTMNDLNSLEKLLQIPIGYQAFSDHLKMEYALENLTFYNEVGIYEKHLDSLKEETGIVSLYRMLLLSKSYLSIQMANNTLLIVLV